tara:strand:- start:994 stop:1347 length:354 start_codon:yes stop_codon:yes gene_type:complete
MKNQKNKNILPPKEFAKRVFKFAVFSICIIVLSLGIGVLGYHFIGGLKWVDSIYNASMILTGMGPVDDLTTDSAKLFASVYALFSGVIFLSTVAIFFAPFAHRLMHLLRIGPIDNQE